MPKKVNKINGLVIILFCFCSFLLNSCVKVQKCEVKPDYERIGESISDNEGNLSETELRSGILSC